MFERFTEKAIKVIMLAQEEARRLGHNFVGTEQILLGLIGEGTGGAGASPIYRAVDKATGEILHEMELPDNQTGLPMTYEHDGKQYIAMWIGGSGQPTQLIAYALPD